MKKILMFASLIALAGALSSCLDTGLVSISDIRFTSDWTIVKNGTTRYVVCSNQQTQVTYSFSVSGIGYLKNWDSVFVGKVTGDTVPFFGKTISDSDVILSGNTVSVSTNFVNAPRSGTPRAVVVTPIPNPTGNGALDLRLTIRDTQGGSATGLISNFSLADAIPVVDNCPAK
jgi:hypothetical protein